MQDAIRCRVCGKETWLITPAHLRTHGMTIAEYRMRWKDDPVSAKKEDGSKVIDRSGLRFGLLVVSDKWETRREGGKKNAYWLCRCDCGKEKWIEASRIGTGFRSCGCLKGSRIEVGMASRNRRLRSYKQDARKRGHAFKLTVKQFTDIATGDCFYCGCKPMHVQKAEGKNGDWVYNGIDRKDNTKGYVVENCVSCCTACNLAKRDMTQTEFFGWVERVHNHIINGGYGQ